MKITSLAVWFSLLFAIAHVAAQEVPNFPVPQKEHEWLKQFVGEWDSEAEGPAGPGQPAMKCKSTVNSRMIGGFWVVSESKGDVGGVQLNAIQTIGYDGKKKKYVGTWVDSILGHMWKYEGTVDAAGKTIALDAEGPNFMVEGKMAKFRDAYEFKSKDHIVFTSSMQGEDGKWVTFMTGNMKRKK